MVLNQLKKKRIYKKMKLFGLLLCSLGVLSSCASHHVGDQVDTTFLKCNKNKDVCLVIGEDDNDLGYVISIDGKPLPEKQTVVSECVKCYFGNKFCKYRFNDGETNGWRDYYGEL